jgi:biopolymer transport protein ExbD
MHIDSPNTEAVINVTPLIDVLLVLLITFMLLPSRTKGLPAEAPDPAPDTAPANPLDVVVRIAKDRSIAIDSQPVAAAELDARLRLAFAARPGGVLFVDGARELEFADVASVIDVARGAGIGRIGLITDREGERERP